MAGTGSAGNVLAALGSFFIPGPGRLVQGRPFTGPAWLAMVVFAWISSLVSLVMPGVFSLVLIPLGPAAHLTCVVEAARHGPETK